MIIQMCGLSGAGKSTLAQRAKAELEARDIPVEIIDGDDYRANICKDLGFSREDRMENIRRLGFIANRFSHHGIVVIICAINPYEEVRAELKKKYDNVNTVFIKCSMEELMRRDTKGLYKKAMLPNDHKEKINNLTGVNDPFEVPLTPDLVVDTSNASAEEAASKLVDFMVAALHHARK